MKKYYAILGSILMMSASIGTAFADNTTSNTMDETSNETSIEEVSPYGYRGVITADNVRMRKTPGTSSTVLKHLHTGTVVDVPTGVDPISKDGYKWIYIVHGGVSGWVASNYINISK